jgi:NitT/TauT family transport system ATP-binding protein
VTNVRIVRPELSDEEVKTALAAVGLRENACIISEYSGGMKRRVAIVRALMADWDVLFMDEPFRGLDEISRKLTIDYISQLLKGRTCVLVTHDPDEPQLMGAESIITLKV